jgi:hypothetical protein
MTIAGRIFRISVFANLIVALWLGGSPGTPLATIELHAPAAVLSYQMDGPGGCCP